MKMAYVYGALVVLVVAGIVAAKNFAGEDGRTTRVSRYDGFAQCLTDAGVKFYGAYWCPHCQAQKRLFENSSKLPYIECSTPNGQGQTQVCIEAGITGYPTWELADGTRLDGEQTLEVLAENSGCELPVF